MNSENLKDSKKFSELNNFKKFETDSDLENEVVNKITTTAFYYPKGLIGLSVSNDFQNIYQILFDKVDRKNFQKISITLSTEIADGTEANFNKFSSLLLDNLGINKKRINTPLRIGKKVLHPSEINKFSKLIMKNNYHDLLLISFNEKSGAIEAIEPSSDHGDIHLLSEVKNIDDKKIASIGLAEILNAKEIIVLVKSNEALKTILKLFSMTKYDSSFPLSSLLNAVGKVNFYSNLRFPVNDQDITEMDSSISVKIDEVVSPAIKDISEVTKSEQLQSEESDKKISKKINAKKLWQLESMKSSKNNLQDNAFENNFYGSEDEDENFRFHVVNEKAELLKRHRILRRKILVISEKASVLKVARMEYLDQIDNDMITKVIVQIIDHKGNIKRYDEQNLITRIETKPNPKPLKKLRTSKVKVNSKQNLTSKSTLELMSPKKLGTPSSIGDA